MPSNNLSDFLTAIMNEAELKKEKIRKETRLFVAKELEEAENEVLKESYDYIQRTAGQIRSAAGKMVSVASMNANRKLLLRRTEIFDEVISVVKQKLYDFSKSDGYVQFLKASATKITERFVGQDFTVYISKQDEDKATVISEMFDGKSVVVDSSVRLGGLKAVNAANTICIDDTLDTRLLAQSEWFRSNSGLILS